MAPGVSRPELLGAEDVSLSDDAQVAGLVVNGEPRAYAVAALSTMRTHVVNDLIGVKPVTVTYCDQADCLRVLTRSDHPQPLTVSLAGWNGREMLVMIDGAMYPQSSPQIPLPEIAAERMTWKEWREKHPNSKVYVGHLQPTHGSERNMTVP